MAGFSHRYLLLIINSFKSILSNDLFVDLMKFKGMRFSAWVVLFSAMLVVGCKKGENDPFISFKSRDGRISGTWKLISLESTDSYSSVGGTSVTTKNYDGSILTTISSGSSDVESYSYEITIEKNGNYSSIEITDGTTVEKEGHWWWLDDAKNKTRITFEDDFSSYKIDQLKNKELILTESYTSETVFDASTSTSEYSATYIYEKQ